MNNNNPKIGETGTALTLYKLRKNGISCEEVNAERTYDIIADYYNKLWRVQVKTTNILDGKSFRFLTARGRFSPSPHHKPLSLYTYEYTDMFALVALPIEKVIFVPVFNVSSFSTNIKFENFTNDACELESFKASCMEIMTK